MSPTWAVGQVEGDAKTSPKVRTRGGNRKLGVRRAPWVRILVFFPVGESRGGAPTRQTYNNNDIYQNDP